ncbi:hypothetical protein KIN20_035783 [Parelaphostrongylus tenuis]|uniref:Uncharacterized protein n=1 Tax=Parelaphostrongylus tenuis TaxID=148309 RepID=A0AAD5WKU6_PARTN|nr:hypothetical protein KIN20_035783 [Parelaphostrongylus tenuis]
MTIADATLISFGFKFAETFRRIDGVWGDGRVGRTKTCAIAFYGLSQSLFAERALEEIEPDCELFGMDSDVVKGAEFMKKGKFYRPKFIVDKTTLKRKGRKIEQFNENREVPLNTLEVEERTLQETTKVLEEIAKDRVICQIVSGESIVLLCEAVHIHRRV